jgi:hypothetical protein
MIIFQPRSSTPCIKLAGGDKGRKYINYLLNGRKQSTSNDKWFAKGVKRGIPDGQDEERHVTFAEDDADNDSPEDESASAAFGHGPTNRHLDNQGSKVRYMMYLTRSRRPLPRPWHPRQTMISNTGQRLTPESTLFVLRKDLPDD